MNVKLTTIVFLSLFLCSCALKDDLPSEWGSLNSDCSDVRIVVFNKHAHNKALKSLPSVAGTHTRGRFAIIAPRMCPLA
ncbi:exported hypothetical protein [Alteromonas sp. 38]|nr:exported hypothetical protein [Alteromonas sp. 38]